ncbi:MAG TPA: tetratricopeptide repeat protein [Abditibacteriaceae bacterium]|jgi:tetratricopeptide (TPR) repeat protein
MKNSFFLVPRVALALRAAPALALGASLLLNVPKAIAQSNSQQAIRLNNQALNEYYRGNYAAALGLYDQSVAINSSSKVTFLNRSATQRALGKYEDALKDLSRALELGMEEDRIESERSEIYLDSGNLKAALAASNRSISLNPSNAFYYNDRGLIHTAAGRYPQAIADFNKSVLMGASGAEILVNRAHAFRLNKQYADALADVSEAIVVAPDKESAYIERARILQLQKQTKKALDSLKTALRLNPRSALAYEIRGSIYLQAKNFDLAIADLTQASKLAPDDVDVLFSLAHAEGARFYSEYESLGTAAIGSKEIKLEGRITRVDATTFNLAASSFTNSAGNRGELSPPKAKTVSVSTTTQWLNRNETKPTLADLKAGTLVHVIGRDDGKTLVASRVLLALNTAPSPTILEGIIGRPRFTISEKQTVRAGTGFLAQLSDNRKVLLTARHLLGPDGGMKTKLSDDEVAALQSVKLFDYEGKAEHAIAGKYIAFNKAADEDDKSFFDAIAFEISDNDKPALLLASTLPVAGEPAWIAGQTVGATGNATQLYPATVMGATAEEIVIRAEPSIQLRALSGAPVINREGKVLGMVLSSYGALTLLNPAATIAARLTP